MLRLLHTLRVHGHALRTMWQATLKTSVATTRLGWLWWLADPLVMMAIFYFVVRTVLRRGGEDYHFFVLSGLVVWQFFARSLYLTADSLRVNRSLIKSVALPLEFYTLLPALVQGVFALCGVGLVLALQPQQIGLHSLAALPLLGVTALLAWGLGLVFCVWQARMPDVGKFLQYALRAGLFLSPVLYDVDGVQNAPELLQRLYACNPMAWILPAMRGVLLEGRMFDWAGFAFWLGLTLLLAQAGLWRLRRQAAQVVKCL